MAIQSIESSTDYFSNFGISIIDIQVNPACTCPPSPILPRAHIIPPPYCCRSSTTCARTRARRNFSTRTSKRDEAEGAESKEQGIMIRETENEIKKRQVDLDMQMM